MIWWQVTLVCSAGHMYACLLFAGVSALGHTVVGGEKGLA